MYAIWVFAVAVGVVTADIGLGYHYKVPQTSYGVPSYQFGESSGHFTSGLGSGVSKGQTTYFGSGHGIQSGNAGHSGSGLSSGVLSGISSGSSSGFGSGSSSSFGSGSSSTFGSGLSSGIGSGLSSGIGSGLSSAIKTGSSGGFGGSSITDFGSGLGNVNSGQYFHSTGSLNSGANTVHPLFSGNSGYSEYQSSAHQKYQQHYQIQQQPAAVYKHFYVHAAPEEPEVPRPRTPIVLPPAQKHYKIIFVKTPSQASRISTVVPVQQQNEEKTIVYVLVKKPEEYQDVIVPKVEQKPPSKPEVFFIKYNDKQDSDAVIKNIVKDYNKSGQTVTFANAGDSQGLSESSGSSILSDLSVPSVSTSGLSTLTGLSSSQSTGSGLDGAPGASGAHSDVFDDSGLHSGHTITTSEVSGTPLEISLPSTLGTHTFNTQSFETAPVAQTLNLGAVDAGSQVVVPGSDTIKYFTSSPVSTTVSSIVYDDVNTISTNQGIPHETYGPPKFRV